MLKISNSLRFMVETTSKATWDSFQEGYGQPGAAGVFVDFQKAIHWKMNSNRNPAEEISELMTIMQ